MIAHKLTSTKKPFRCSVCLQTWQGKPRSECPGLPVYERVPDDLTLRDNLFQKGLKLSDDQRIVAYYTKYKLPLYALSACEPHGLDITFDQGKYKFLETPDGFEIWRVNGLNVTVTYDDTWLKVQHRYTMRCGLYNWPEALHEASESLANQLVSDDTEEATEMISKALSYRFFLGWKRIIAEIAPTEVGDLARLVFSSVRGDALVLHAPELYTEDHIHTRSDLIKYHACRLYAATTPEPSDVAAWRQRLSPTVPNKALNKTLDKMPPAISYKQIVRLSTIRLESPITSRLHLIFILCASDHHNWGLHERTVVSATPAMIQQVGVLHGKVLKAQSKTRVIGDLAQQILDYPEPYGGDLLGLAQRSMEWHRQIANAEDAGGGILPADTPLAVPTHLDLDALAERGITLLRTAGDCYAEHDKMHHCIHTYASKAAKGLCFLFHAVYTKDDVTTHATLEVSPQREVIQAQGPMNQKNAACTYGVQELKRALKETIYA